MTEMPETRPILLAEGMHKRYGGVHALRGATLRVNPAEVHALMGENGSGKSTMLRILSGQIHPDAGSIHFDGRPTSFRTPSDALRQGIKNRGTTLLDYRDSWGAAGLNRERLLVFRRQGKPCPTCGTPIEKIRVGQRGTHLCPTCQPAP